MFRKAIYKIVLLFFCSSWMLAQHSYDIYGNLPLTFNERFRVNSLEGNTNNYNSIKDWEFSLVMGYDFQNSGNQNLHLISMGKRIGKHYIYSRYTPGFTKEFNFSSGSIIQNSDTSTISTSLNTKLHYEETFGIGYSYDYSKNLSLGVSVRYFQQSFTQDQISPFFSDTLNFIGIDTRETKSNFFRMDLGFVFRPYKSLLFEVSSANLIIGNSVDTDTLNFGMRNRRSAILRTEYNSGGDFSVYGLYESRGSAIAGLSYTLPLSIGNLSFGLSASHNYLAKHFISALSPSLNFSNELFSVTLAGIKNFKSDEYFGVSYFLDNGFENLSNNIYDGDRVILGVNFSLSFLPEKLVEIEDAKVLEDIYPAFAEEYQTKPVAKALVKNISDDDVSVQPVSFIPNFNDEVIYSPKVTIRKGESKEVFFYTVIPEQLPEIKKRYISQIDLQLFTGKNSPDAEIKKPVLINDLNAWDGKVFNLKYFTLRELNESQKVAKSILKDHKAEIESSDRKLGNYLRTKILFNHFVKDIVYVADPRSVTDRVQFPSETLKLKGGDCDDLSTAFASLLESIGIQTAFVDYKSDDGISHVNLLVNTKLTPEEVGLITNNDKKFIVRKSPSGKSEVWIPLETTLLTNFDDSWNNAAERFNKEAIENLGLAKGKVVINDIY